MDEMKSKSIEGLGIRSFEELMEYVEGEARKRVKEMTNRYRSLVESQPYYKVILQVMREVEGPLSVDLISFLTGINKSRCCKVLKKLEEKWKMVRKVTVSKTAYYVIASKRSLHN